MKVAIQFQIQNLILWWFCIEKYSEFQAIQNQDKLKSALTRKSQPFPIFCGRLDFANILFRIDRGNYNSNIWRIMCSKFSRKSLIFFNMHLIRSQIIKMKELSSVKWEIKYPKLRFEYWNCVRVDLIVEWNNILKFLELHAVIWALNIKNKIEAHAIIRIWSRFCYQIDVEWINQGTFLFKTNHLFIAHKLSKPIFKINLSNFGNCEYSEIPHHISNRMNKNISPLILSYDIYYDD